MRALALMASVALISPLVSCGGSSDSSGAAGSGKGSSASVASFGRQATGTERAGASKSLQEFFGAWVAGDSAKACSLMSASTKQNLAVFASQFKGCTAQVNALRAAMPAKTLARFRGVQVTGMRIDGNRGFLLYRDAQGTSSAFPVIREGAAWRVGAIAGSPVS
jgi:hypothetical protein